MKRILTALALTAALTLSLCPAASAQEREQLPPGTEIGKVYATDIVTYLDGMPMPSYNIGGKTAILVRDLAPYGFEVEWDSEKSWAIVSSGSRPELTPGLCSNDFRRPRSGGGQYLLHRDHRHGQWVSGALLQLRRSHGRHPGRSVRGSDL